MMPIYIKNSNFIIMKKKTRNDIHTQAEMKAVFLFSMYINNLGNFFESVGIIRHGSHILK